MKLNLPIQLRGMTAAAADASSEVLDARYPLLILDGSGNTVNMRFGNGSDPISALADVFSTGGGAWGSITGTLSDQLDLQAALDAKSDVGHTHPVADLSDASANAKSLLQAANYAAMLALLDLEVGTDFPALNHASRHMHGGADEVGNSTPTANAIVKALGTGKIDVGWLPDSIVGQVEYQGTWAASTNTPAIPAASSSNKGYYYVASSAVASSHGYSNVPAVDFQIGDWIISNGTAWEKVDNTDLVTSVAGRLGAITLAVADLSDMSANARTFNQAANYAAMRTALGVAIGSDVQAYSNALQLLSGATSDGISMVTAANYAAMRALLSLGTAALVNTGTGASDVPTITQADARYILQSLIAAKGDLIGASANDTPLVVTVGSDGKQLLADSSQTSGLAYANKARFIIPFYNNPSATLTWSAMPSAATGLNGQLARITLPADLTRFTRCRLTVITGGTGGFAGSKLILRYKTGAYSGTAANYSDIGTSEVSVAIDSSGTATTSSWIDLHASAKADVQITIIGTGGNTSVSPVFTLIAAEFE